MALRAMATKLRIPIIFRRTPASRSVGLQDKVGSTAPPNPAVNNTAAEGISPFFNEKLMNERVRAYEKRMRRDLFIAGRVANFLGLCGRCYLFARVYM